MRCAAPNTDTICEIVIEIEIEIDIWYYQCQQVEHRRSSLLCQRYACNPKTTPFVFFQSFNGRKIVDFFFFFYVAKFIVLFSQFAIAYTFWRITITKITKINKTIKTMKRVLIYLSRYPSSSLSSSLITSRFFGTNLRPKWIASARSRISSCIQCANGFVSSIAARSSTTFRKIK